MRKNKKSNTEKQFELEIGPLCGFIRKIAHKYLFDRTYMDDVAQEVLISTWKQFDHLPKCEQRLKYWLFTVTKRKAYNYGRALKKDNAGLDRAAQIDISGSWAQYGEGKAVPLAVCEPSYLPDPFVVANVKDFLYDLPDTHRDVLVLSVAGLSYREIASATSSKPGTVRSRLHYARLKARRALSCHL
jgi:RNA polymerase sigma factor (sigma-70 family)